MDYTVFYRQQATDPLTGRRHSHIGQIELIQILSGRGTAVLGETEYVFSPGSVLYFDGALPHYIQPETREDYVRSKLILPKSLLQLAGSEALPPQLHFEADPTLQQALENSFCSLSQPQTHSFHGLSLIFEMLHLCFRQAGEKRPAAVSAVSPVLRYIAGNLHTDLPLDQIAQACHMSKYHMCRLFKAKTGVTIGSYIRTQRIYTARQLLEQTDLPISQIALQVGYNELSHFSKAFRGETGLPPSAYRRTLCGRPEGQ